MNSAMLVTVGVGGTRFRMRLHLPFGAYARILWCF